MFRVILFYLSIEMSTIFECWNGLKVKEIGAVVLRGEKKSLNPSDWKGPQCIPQESNLLLKARSALNLGWAAQGFVQLGFENLRVWSLYHPSGQWLQ